MKNVLLFKNIHVFKNIITVFRIGFLTLIFYKNILLDLFLSTFYVIRINKIKILFLIYIL